MAVTAAVLPALALWAGLRVGGPLRTATAHDPAVARSFALVAGLGAALCGCATALLVPGRRALGRQLEAAPVSAAAIYLGLTALPLAFLAAVLAVPLVLFLAPVTREATPAALASLAAAFALGGACAEAVLALSRRALRGVLVAGGVALLCVLGPLDAAVAALRGANEPIPALGLAGAACALAFAAAAFRPDEPAESSPVRLPARGVFASALVRYARRRDVRRHSFAGVGVAAVGAVLLRITGTPSGVAALLAGVTGLLAAAVVPLAAPGFDRRCEWLWRSVPRSRTRLGLTCGVAALLAGAAVATAGAGAAWAAAPTAPQRLTPLVPAAAVVLSAALLAGSLLPWRVGRPAEQAACYAAFGTVLALLLLVLGRVAPHVGAETGAAALALALLALTACTAASAHIVGRRG